MDFTAYISIDKNIRFGKPVVTGTRITVADVLDWLADGMSTDAIIGNYPPCQRKKYMPVLGMPQQKNTMPPLPDADYMSLLNFRGFPPRVIRLRFGNCSNETMIRTLQYYKDTLHTFIKKDDLGILEITTSVSIN